MLIRIIRPLLEGQNNHQPPFAVFLSGNNSQVSGEAPEDYFVVCSFEIQGISYSGGISPPFPYFATEGSLMLYKATFRPVSTVSL